MSSVIRAICALVLVIIANILFWPPRNVLVERNPVQGQWPQKNQFNEILRLIKPQIVFLGNSTLRDGIEPGAFSKYVAAKTVNFIQDGSASAWWYLTLKNVVIKSPFKPQMVGIPFRDTDLTDPSYRVDGEWKYIIDKMAEKDEPLLDRLAYLGRMDAITYFLFRYCPLYQQRDKAKIALNALIKNKCVSAAMGSEPGMADRAIERVFDNNNMDKKLLTARQIAAEAAREGNLYNFPQQVARSFLPHIIALTKQNHIQLVLIRMKTRFATEQPDKEPKELKKYIEELKDYLARNKVPFFDFTYDQRIKIEHYGVGDHLAYLNGGKGRDLFTEILAQTMWPLVRNLNSPSTQKAN